jgi:hypothetical protein
MKGDRLSALSTGLFYPQGIFLVVISARGSVDAKAKVKDYVKEKSIGN